jgi:iron complex outermembrane receptor protein
MKKNHIIILLNVSFLLHKRNFWCRKDASGAALPGVHRKRNTKRVSTNMDGAYKIKVKQGATIVLVTFFQCGKATTASIINVVLSEEGGKHYRKL